MIKNLLIKNFQSHKLTELLFSPGVNIIVGTSDSGKSAILRALKWLVWNRPTGESFRSNWGGQTVVHIETETDRIDRWKHNYENGYRLNTTTFEAIKTDVPQEIQEALNLTSINLQQQLDAPFLLSQSAGEVASFFNRVAKLDMIDSGTQNINKWIREITSDINHKESNETSLTEELTKYEHLEKFEAEVEVLEQMQQSWLSKVTGKNSLSKLINNIHLIEIQITNASQVLSVENLVNNLLVLIEKRSEIDNRMDSLYKLITKIVTINDRIEYHQFNLTSETIVNNILKLIENKKTLTNDKIRLSKALSSINNITYTLKQETSSMTRLLAEFEENMPSGSRCPLCNQIIK